MADLADDFQGTDPSRLSSVYRIFALLCIGK
jgi:hypothetical protein